MPYTLADFERDVEHEVLSKLTPRQRLEGLSLEQRLEGLSLDKIENFVKRQKASQDKGAPELPVTTD